MVFFGDISKEFVEIETILIEDKICNCQMVKQEISRICKK